MTSTPRRRPAMLGVLAAALVASSASATPPGSDGKIAYAHPVASRHTTIAISVVNADGTGGLQLTHPPDGVLDGRPDWSPDGSRIAFERCALRCAIFTIDADGTSLRRIGPSCGRRRPPACEDRGAPAWSPDGRAIAFARGWGAVRRGPGYGPHGQIAHSELYVMDSRGGSVRRITRLTRSRAYSADVGRATWSPDGKRLAFGVSKRAGARALFIVGADGARAKRLTAWKLRGGDHPDFSPDGRQILFGAGAHGPQDRGGDLYTIGSDGNRLTRLTRSGPRGVVSPGSFAPAGARLTFAQLPAGETFATSLFVMAPDGSALRRIAHTEFALEPDWGP